MTDRDTGRLSVLETIEAIDPSKNVPFVAVDILTDPADMEQFIREYAGFLQENSEEEHVRKTPMKVAISDISYWASHKIETVPGNWFDVFEEVRDKSPIVS